MLGGDVRRDFAFAAQGQAVGQVFLECDATPFAVGLFITAGYWFTSSTSFANPAVTIARTLTDTFAGIRAADAPSFIAAEFAGALAALGAARVLYPAAEKPA